MTSILRKLVAGPRIHHAETGLDLCYVTDQIIATSGPSSSYPQRAYRNPLSSLVRYLDEKHGVDWAIWEFRAEGTGYPDDEVYGRIWHFPWPDHHPPPFQLIPGIMGSMRDWLEGGEKRVVVVHCKAGKGRSGTIACSYLISHCGWEPHEAMARFTERRMRAGFGQGISIPSQVRWVHYVDQWTRNGKKYVERSIEVIEVHVWGLREGVKVAVEGYVDEGRGIKTFHVFDVDERIIVSEEKEEDAEEEEEDDDDDSEEKDHGRLQVRKSLEVSATKSGHSTPRPTTTREDSNRNLSLPSSPILQPSSKTMPPAIDTSITLSKEKEKEKEKEKCSPGTEPGGMAVLFRPRPGTRIILPTNDVNLAVERRTPISSRGPSSWQMVTAVAHVWFNTFFEGDEKHSEPSLESSGKIKDEGEEKPLSNAINSVSCEGKQETPVNDSGVFEIDWESMDGIKGTSKRGTRALDRMAVVWKVVTPSDDDDFQNGAVAVAKEMSTKKGKNWHSKKRHKKQTSSLGRLVTVPLDTKGSSNSSASTGTATPSSPVTTTTVITPTITTSPPGSIEAVIPQIHTTTKTMPTDTSIGDAKNKNNDVITGPTLATTRTTNASIHSAPTTTTTSTPATLPTTSTALSTNKSHQEDHSSHDHSTDPNKILTDTDTNTDRGTAREQIHSPKSIPEPSSPPPLSSLSNDNDNGNDNTIKTKDKQPADLKGHGGTTKEAGDHGINRELGIKKEKLPSSSFASGSGSGSGSGSSTTAAGHSLSTSSA
ncbi:MAG: hypothetical protein M1823_004482 [Watsoniomyces obsoletus]|nr:MAG: hypothetical protein M1823_004482 [Watsoniomyces obsoletus]